MTFYSKYYISNRQVSYSWSKEKGLNDEEEDNLYFYFFNI